MDKKTFEASNKSNVDNKTKNEENIKSSSNEANSSKEDNNLKDHMESEYSLSYDDRDENKSVHTLDDKNRFSDLETAILVKDLDLYYGDFQALKHVNMDIKKGQVTAFIGPSGCGKSTTLKCFNRMNDLVDSCKIEGLIKINDKDIYKPDVNVVNLRRNVGMVFQTPNPFSKSIYDNLTYGPKIDGIKDKDSLDEIVETSLKQAAIWDEVKDKLDQNALSFSGGQQQRICIARTLSVKPDIILMDEPTSALDPISTSSIEDLMEDLKKQ